MTGTLGHAVSNTKQSRITDFFVTKKDDDVYGDVIVEEVIEEDVDVYGDVIKEEDYATVMFIDDVGMDWEKVFQILEDFLFSRTVRWLFFIEAIILVMCGTVTGWVVFRY